MEVAPAGTVPAEQVEGDCRTLVCDGRGQAVARADGADVPADDGNACTEERCAGDRAEHAPLAAGQPCGRGGVCNGAGVCGVCAPGEGKCEEGVPSLCEPSGQWQRAERRCDGDVPVCFAGTCAPASALALGPAATCVLTPAGTRCDGSADAALLSMERRVKILDGARDLAVGRRHACALRADGAVFCWGDGSRGQLGGGPSGALVRVVGGAEQVAAGDAHTCARLRVGAVACWGADDRGQLGDGTKRARQVPVVLDEVGPSREVAAAGDHTCLLPQGKSLPFCWGDGAAAPATFR